MSSHATLLPASDEVGLAGYTDRLSGRPGDTVRFHVSSTANGGNGGAVSAKMTRCICADPNPAGPGRIEEDASAWFPPREFVGRRREVRPGSYARSRDAVVVPREATGVTVEVWMYPTHIDSTVAGRQCVWSWGGLGLYLDSDGRPILRHDGTDLRMEVSSPSSLTEAPALTLHRWYHCRVDVDLAPDGSLAQCRLTVRRQDRFTKQLSTVVVGACRIDRPSVIPVNAHFELASGGTFNGRLENPRITYSGASMSSKTLVGWDTSQNISEWSVPSTEDSTLGENPLILYNHPTRAVRGRLWDGTDLDWRHRPAHYGGVHFHDDDCYDLGWECDMEWTIPEMPSGIYIVRLTNDAGDEEALPLFVCPPLVQATGEGPGAKEKKKEKKLCVLMSTFTYVMYGNHARTDWQPSWMDRIREWNAYPHVPGNHPKYGCSTYNFHTDGSGICFASHRRPLFNVRPGYLTFGDSTCSGLRHFPADTHLIAFLHHHSIDYDIVTDHELHKDGAAALVGYHTLVTGSHPEYHSEESLNALQEFRDAQGGNLMYLGGNGFYWRIAAMDEDASILEVRRCEGGVRTWASEPGEYFHMLGGGSYGGLWRRNDRPPQRLVGVGFTAQGSFEGMPYRRVCYDKDMDWLFEGIQDEELLGNFGFSGNGAAGFELDRVDRRLDGDDHKIIILAQAFDKGNDFMLVPEEILTTYANLSGSSNDHEP